MDKKTKILMEQVVQEDLEKVLSGVDEDDKKKIMARVIPLLDKIVELEKSSLTAKRIVFELSKVVLPLLISAGVYFTAEDILLGFETKGTRTCSLWRNLTLPKFFK